MLRKLNPSFERSGLFDMTYMKEYRAYQYPSLLEREPMAIASVMKVVPLL